MNVLGKISSFVFVLLAVLLVSQSVSAGSVYFGYADGDYLIQIHRDGRWIVGGYSDYIEGWYYYDYPYRYHYSGSWYYFEPGWYSYYDSWYTHPYYGYYDYYPVGYYNYGGYWYYEPAMYYNIYYYDFYVNPPLYLYGYGCCGTGISGVYGEHASCGDIDLIAPDLKIDIGGMEYLTLTIENNSKYKLEIKDIDVEVTTKDILAEVQNYNRNVAGQTKKDVKIRFSADGIVQPGEYAAEIKLDLRFGDGTYCTPTEEISIFVRDNSEPEISYDEYGTGYSTSRFTPYESNDDYGDCTPSESADSYEEEGQEVGTVYLEEAAASCSNLDLVAANITADAGGTAQELFTLKNYNNEQFYVDNVAVWDNSEAFELGVEPAYGKVYELSTMSIEVMAYGSESAVDEFGNGYISAEGHFPNGESCQLEEQFYVYVNGVPENECNRFKLNVQGEAEFSTAGVIVFSFENALNEDVEVSVEGINAVVMPGHFTLSKMTAGERVVRVRHFNAESGMVIFTAQLSGCNHPQKVTYLVNPIYFSEGTEEEEVPPEQADLTLESYASQITIDDNAAVSVTLKNNSDRTKIARVSLTQLPDTIRAIDVVVELEAGETRSVTLNIFNYGASNATYVGKLEIRFDDSVIYKDVLIDVKVEEEPPQEADDTQPSEQEVPSEEEEDVIGDTLTTAFVVLNENALILGILVLAIVLIYGLYRLSNRKQEGGELWADFDFKGE